MLRGPSHRGIVLVALFSLAGCNLITGADEFAFDDGGSGAQGGSSGVAGNGPGPGGAGGAGGAAAVCGNTTCEPGEDCISCEGDCGPCAATCGNSTCDTAETCTNCPTDCGACDPVCGDGTCEPSESCSSCAADCGACASCGDGTCNGGETCTTCAGDCGPCGPMCGDGTCDMGETQENCSSDCGSPTGCGGAGDATTTLDAEELAFVVLLNEYRGQQGLGAVTACTSLNRAAQGHSEDMRDQNYFDHDGLNGSSPWDRMCDACYDLGCGPMTAVAENIAAGNSGA